MKFKKKVISLVGGKSGKRHSLTVTYVNKQAEKVLQTFWGDSKEEAEKAAVAEVNKYL